MKTCKIKKQLPLDAGQPAFAVLSSTHGRQWAPKLALAGILALCGSLLAGTCFAADSDLATGAWPPSVKPPAGAPNIVFIVLDDVGYSWSSVFGGPVPTPNIDRLANQGLRYNNFHVNALCSPTRAALLSGRNAHEIGFGTITEGANREPGYTSIWPKNAVSIAEVLKRNGYSTAAFGKWHNTPTWEVNPAGPFTHWPTSLGFEYFYGFLGAATTQYDPALFQNTTPVELPKTPEQGYLLNPDLVDHAEQWVHQHDASAPDRPFFLYFATGAIHAPHHVPRDWIGKFKGQFDLGWDKQREVTFAKEKALGVIPANAELTPRPKQLPAWDSLTADEKRLYAAQAELYAAYLAETDYELGRLLNDLQAGGHANDTAIFVLVGDNGASGEGGLEGTIGYPATVEEQLKHLDEFGSRDLANHVESAWAWAAVTPFQWMKQVASHLGGTTDPLIVSWPGHIKDAGGVRSQFSFVTDIAPTLYELAGVTFPEEVDGVKQLPLEGSSLVFSFDDAQAPSRHNQQYFEMVGNRGIYQDGWWAGSRQGVPWAVPGGKGEPGPWELYNLTNDFSQAHNVADQYPDKLKQLEALYASEAERNHVYPKAGRGLGVGGAALAQASFQTNWTFQPGAERIPARYVPRLGGSSHHITADIDVETNLPNGVIFAEGGRKGGFALFVKNGRVIYEGTPSSTSPETVPHTQIIASERLPQGKSVIEVVAARIEAAPGTTAAQPRPALRRGRWALAGRNGNQAFAIDLLINGKKVGGGEFAGVPLGGGSLTIGSNTGNPVSRDYENPNPFNGVINQVAFSVTPSAGQPTGTGNLAGPWHKGDSLDSGEAPQIADHALVISAEIEPAGTNGVIISQGAGAYGYALYLQDGKPAFAVRDQGALTTVLASEPIRSGHFKLEARLATNGAITISVDGKVVATGQAPGLISNQPALGLSVGYNDSSVGDYNAPNSFTGTIENVTVQTL